MTPYKGRALDPTAPVRVYRNLHGRAPDQRWSVLQHRLVVGHAAWIQLDHARLLVSPHGVRAAQRLGHRVVCAWAEGHVVAAGAELQADPEGVPFWFADGAFHTAAGPAQPQPRLRVYLGHHALLQEAEHGVPDAG